MEISPKEVTGNWKLLIGKAMKNYGTFEDLELYKTAREFRKAIYLLIKQLPDE